jgi:predicted site-specific integrase-resolvase
MDNTILKSMSKAKIVIVDKLERSVEEMREDMFNEVTDIITLFSKKIPGLEAYKTLLENKKIEILEK